MISRKPDPFLNEVNNFEDVQIGLDVFSNSKGYELDFEENSIDFVISPKKKRSCYKGKYDIFTNFVEKFDMPKISKYDILEAELEKGNHLYIDLVQMEDTLKLHIRNSSGKEVLEFHLIQSSEMKDQAKYPLIRQSVEVVTKVELAQKLNVFLPKLQTEQGLKVFLCPVHHCNVAYIKTTTARKHSLMHLKIKPYKCTFDGCKWAFYTASKLRRHEETHSKRKDYACPAEGCGRRFTTVYNLNGHKRTHVRPADLSCFVEHCPKMFQTTKARQLHMKTHRRSEGAYRCPEPNCARRFFTEAALFSHGKLHSHDTTDLVCEWPGCGKAFEQPYRLKEHMRLHTGQRPYRCPNADCKWSFATASKLRRHQVTHTNERKFHCTIGNCNKSFLRSEHLKHHTLTHIAQRSFVCDVCFEEIAGKSSLLVHMKKKHPKKVKITCTGSQPRSPSPEKATTSDALLEQAIQSLGVPSYMMLNTGVLPEESLGMLENENFSTVNLNDLQ